MSYLCKYENLSSRTSKISKTISVTSSSDGSLYFSGDIEGQIKYKKSGNDILINIYKVSNGTVTGTLLGTVKLKNALSSHSNDSDGLWLETDQTRKIWSGDGVNYGCFIQNDAFWNGYVNNYSLYDTSSGGASAVATSTKGADTDDTLVGSGKSNKITTGNGNDTITGGAGNDTIVINGEGVKTIYVAQGDGSDTVSVNVKTDSDGKKWLIDQNGNKHDVTNLTVNVVFGNKDTGVDTTINDYKFERSMTDVKVTAVRNEVEGESVTIKNYTSAATFGEKNYLSSDYGKITLNCTDGDYSNEAYNLKTVMKNHEAGTVVNPVKVSALISLLKKAGFGSYLSGINIPSAIKSISLFRGTDGNDIFNGTKGKDIMYSSGGTHNVFNTGKKGQTAIISQGASDDTYVVESFTAGTLIMDGGENDGYVGSDNLTMKGVNVNDIHLALKPSFEVNNSTGSGSSVNFSDAGITFFTDSKGLSNFAGIDFGGLISKAVNKVLGIEASKEKAVSKAKTEAQESAAKLKAEKKEANMAMSMSTGLMSKFRGVAITSATGSASSTDDVDLVKSSMLSNDVAIVDTKGNEQVITKESLSLYANMMQKSLHTYFDHIAAKYKNHLENVVYKSATDSTPAISYYQALTDGTYNIAVLAQYVAIYPTMAKLMKSFNKTNKAIYNAIKKGFFNAYTNMYIGTDGDNSYTIKKSEKGAVIVSGTGNDTFTFKGALGYKYDADKFVSNPEYAIASTMERSSEGSANVVNADKLVVSGYALNKGTLSVKGLTLVNFGDACAMDDIEFEVRDFKKGTSATISYDMKDADGQDLFFMKNGDTLLNIQDSSKKTYSLKAISSSEWTASGSGDLVVNINTGAATMNSGAGTNIIAAAGKLTYNYNGGNDTVFSNGIEDKYNVAFSSDTSLTVVDSGVADSDVLNLTGVTGSNLRILFNVDKDRNYDQGDFTVVTADNFNKANVSAILGETGKIVVDKGISCDNVEYLSVNGNMVGYDFDSISGSVQAWLTSGGKYDDAAEAFANGSKQEVNELLNIYASGNLS